MKGVRVPLEEQAARRRESNRAWHWKRRALGICKTCGISHAGYTWLCRQCRIQQSARQKKDTA